MSDLLIKGMEMPRGCATCQYCDRAWNKPKCKAKSVQGRFMEQRLNLDRTRQKWCPLIPVPPHGRLIDADALMLKIQEYIEEYGEDVDDRGWHNLKWCAMKEAEMAINDAETVLNSTR